MKSTDTPEADIPEVDIAALAMAELYPSEPEEVAQQEEAPTVKPEEAAEPPPVGKEDPQKGFRKVDLTAVRKKAAAKKQTKEVAERERKTPTTRPPATVPAAGDTRTDPQGTKEKIRIQWADEIELEADSPDLVAGHISPDSNVVFYGASNSCKTFLALDLAASIASGQPWRGEHEVLQGSVLYVALEGLRGIKRRVLGLKAAGKLPPGSPLAIAHTDLSLLRDADVDELVDLLLRMASEQSQPVRLIVIDTLSRALAGENENAGEVMSKAVQSVDRLRAATGAAVLIVHHSGKNEAAGARGHSSLRAAIDTEFEITRKEGDDIATVRTCKQRDREYAPPMAFSLEVVQIGIGADGLPVKTCVVRHEADILASNQGKPGRKPTASDAELIALLPCGSTKEWAESARDELGVERSAFYRIKAALVAKRTVQPDGEGGWKAT